jgi:hypothetical protein
MHASREASLESFGQLVFVLAFSVFLGALLGGAVGFGLAWRSIIEGTLGNDAADWRLLKAATASGALIGVGYFIIQVLRVRAQQAK